MTRPPKNKPHAILLAIISMLLIHVGGCANSPPSPTATPSQAQINPKPSPSTTQRQSDEPGTTEADAASEPEVLSDDTETTDSSEAQDSNDVLCDISNQDALNDHGPSEAEPTECDEIGTECFNASACCGELFCSYTGNNYMPGTCSAALADGSPCLEDSWCLSGQCIDGLCQDAPCGGLDTLCYADTECCEGSFCTWSGANPYTAGTCRPPQALGAPCEADSWCESGLCADSMCASESCLELDASCASAEDCCTGLCTSQLPEASPAEPGNCVEKQPDGQPCASHDWCLNGWCQDGSCQPKTCADGEDLCFSDFDCCEGFCSYSGAYIPGKCLQPLPTGSWCQHDSWCETGHCIDGLCVVDGCAEVESNCHSGAECCSGMCTATGSETGVCVNPAHNGYPCVGDAWCLSNHCEGGVCATPNDALGFEQLWNQVLEPAGCASGYCHGSPNSDPNFLYMGDVHSAYNNLIGTAAAGPACGAVLRVVPGIPDASVLWLRVRPHSMDQGAPCLPKMPAGSEGLSTQDAALVRNWIEAGAPF